MSKADKSYLADLFKQPCTCVQTSGTQEGTILKFATFYLKIYDDEDNASYNVQGYRYNSPMRIFDDHVPANKMREYASRF